MTADLIPKPSVLGRLVELEAAACGAPWFDDYGKLGAGDSGIGEMDDADDAAFIAAARNALPALIAVARAAQDLIVGTPPEETLRDALAALDGAGL